MVMTHIYSAKTQQQPLTCNTICHALSCISIVQGTHTFMFDIYILASHVNTCIYIPLVYCEILIKKYILLMTMNIIKILYIKKFPPTPLNYQFLQNLNFQTNWSQAIKWSVKWKSERPQNHDFVNKEPLICLNSGILFIATTITIDAYIAFSSITNFLLTMN